MAYKKDFPIKEGLIGIQEAADYLNCSHQALSKILKEERENPLCEHFRFYAGYFRTTYALLDEFFTNGQVTYKASEQVTYKGDQCGLNESDKE